MLISFVVAASGYIASPLHTPQLAARRGGALLPRAAPTAVLDAAAATNLVTVSCVAANAAIGVFAGVVVREGGYVLGGATNFWGKGTSGKARRAEVCAVFSSCPLCVPPCAPAFSSPSLSRTTLGSTTSSASAGRPQAFPYSLDPCIPFHPTGFLLDPLLQRFRRKQEESTGDLASAYLIPNIVLVPLVYAAFDPSSHEFPWLVAMYMGLILSDPDLWRLLARISYYDDEDEEEEEDDWDRLGKYAASRSEIE